MIPIIDAIPGLITAIGSIADDLITTDKERIELALREKELDMKPVLAQVDVNKIEATSLSILVAGWRPAVGWICGFALAYAAILEPLFRFVSAVLFGYTGGFPVIDTNITMQVLFGMLGLGAMRTLDKSKGVASKG